MKSLIDPTHTLNSGLATIRQQFQVPPAFPPEVLAAANDAATRAPTAHQDRTALHFVTLDPATSTDLDQAFAIEVAGADIILKYAIADVAWFVDDGGVLDAEAWKRGATVYMPDGKAGLYPPVLSENAASLLPDGPRPAVVFTVRVDADGVPKLDGAERAIIQSRAKLAYDSVRAADLPTGFAELARRMQAAEVARGAARVDPPEQEVGHDAQGRPELLFRPRLQSEEDNAALSLATNLAIADALHANATGLFRVMDEPGEPAIRRLRHTARAFGLDWPESASLSDYEKTLDPADARQAAFMLAIRRAGNGASYKPYEAGVTPWHSAMAATYTHATAPLRRLADRYIVRAALSVANGEPVEPVVADAFQRLPKIMARADSLGNQVNNAVIDLAETIVLQEKVGQSFDAIVTDIDERGVRMQLTDYPVVARVVARGTNPGDAMQVRLVKADTASRTLEFERIA